jgi:hypothetical protein
MKLNRFFIFLIPVFIFFSCHAYLPEKDEIQNAMHLYNHLLEKMDADSLALMYTADGNLGDLVIGRDSIRAFLKSFKNIRVISAQFFEKSTEINKPEATQEGLYHQTSIIDAKDTIKLTGKYIANWRWINGEGWRLKKMITIPSK